MLGGDHTLHAILLQRVEAVHAIMQLVQSRMIMLHLFLLTLSKSVHTELHIWLHTILFIILLNAVVGSTQPISIPLQAQDGDVLQAGRASLADVQVIEVTSLGRRWLEIVQA